MSSTDLPLRSAGSACGEAHELGPRIIAEEMGRRGLDPVKVDIVEPGTERFDPVPQRERLRALGNMTQRRPPAQIARRRGEPHDQADDIDFAN